MHAIFWLFVAAGTLSAYRVWCVSVDWAAQKRQSAYAPQWPASTWCVWSAVFFVAAFLWWALFL